MPSTLRSTFPSELVPTWAKVAAWAAPVTTLPSITWRLIGAVRGFAGTNPCIPPSTPLMEQLYILVVLPSVQLGLALLTVGLVRPWGEVFPRWMPMIGGRRVPVSLAVGAAVTGSILLVRFLMNGLDHLVTGASPQSLEPLAPGCSVPGWEVLRWYVPMVLWPPLLLAVTWHYLCRRRATNKLP